MVPHLVTALTGPINELEQRVLDSMPAIERWFRLEWMEHTPPFYTAVDLRNAGFKLAPVDTNLFPGGWQQPDAGDAAVGRAGGDGGHREDLPGGAQPAGDPGKPVRSSVLPEQPGSAAPASSAWPGLNVRLGSIDPAIKRADARSTCPMASRVTLEPVIVRTAPAWG